MISGTECNIMHDQPLPGNMRYKHYGRSQIGTLTISNLVLFSSLRPLAFLLLQCGLIASQILILDWSSLLIDSSGFGLIDQSQIALLKIIQGILSFKEVSHILSTKTQLTNNSIHLFLIPKRNNRYVKVCAHYSKSKGLTLQNHPTHKLIFR